MAIINLTRYALSPQTLVKEQHAYPVKVVASSDDMPSEVFVFVRGKSTGTDPQVGDSFECVASVPQLSEIPVVGTDVASEPLTQIPYYRGSEVTLFARTEVEANKIWERIKQDVSILVANYNTKDLLVVTETVEIAG